MTGLLDAKAALIVIDMEKGVVPYIPEDAAPALVARVGRLARAFRTSKRLVVLTVQHPGGPPGRTDTASSSPEVPDDFLELVPELEAHPDDLVIHKSQWSAFTGTGLDESLREADVTQVVLCGIATSMGVESSARIAHELRYNVLIVDDATADSSPDHDWHSKSNVLPRIGQVRSTQVLLDDLTQGLAAAE